MATVADVIRDAYRRSGVTAAAAVIRLTAVQQAVGLTRLKGLYLAMFNNGTFGAMTDYYLNTGNYTAKENQRIYKADPTSVITIPVPLVDPCTGLTRAPIDGSILQIIDPVSKVPSIYRYNAARAEWEDLVNITATSIAPMTYGFEEQIKDLLGIELCDEQGISPSSLLTHQAALAKQLIGSKPNTPRKQARLVFF